MKSDELTQASRWRESTLGDLCKMYQPKTIGKKDMAVDGAYPVFGANGVMGRYHLFNHEEPQLVIGCRGACGTVHITEPKSWITGNSMVVQPKLSDVDLQYLKYFFLGPADLGAIVSGAAQPQITQTALKPVKVPLPPLEEQRRIVAVLDQAFAALDRARALAEANLADAEELFANGCNEVFEGLASRFEARKLAELAFKITKGSSPKWQGFSYVDEPGILFVTSENVLTNAMSFEKTKYVEEGFNEKDRKSILKKGDVLTNIVGASIGRTAVFERDDNANINQAVCLIRCMPGMLQNHFLAYLLNSPYFKTMLHEGEVNMARANLSLTFFREFEVPLPPLKVQDQIVGQIDALRQKTDAAEEHYANQLEDLEDLRQSLLQKAFAGGLT